MVTRIKVCCIGSIEEARLAVEAGASALGLVSSMPSGPGVISESLIAEIATTVPPAVGTFLLTSLQDAKAIIAQQRRCHTNTIQICDRLATDTHAQLREALPGISLVQVIHVTDSQSVDEACQIALNVDAILLDSGNRTLPVKELGGTGRVHDWSLSRRIRDTVAVLDTVAVPIFLAGGLNPENVGAAIKQVHPFGVDVCSGLRTDGRLAPTQLEAFVAAVRTADAERT